MEVFLLMCHICVHIDVTSFLYRLSTRKKGGELAVEYKMISI